MGHSTNQAKLERWQVVVDVFWKSSKYLFQHLLLVCIFPHEYFSFFASLLEAQTQLDLAMVFIWFRMPSGSCFLCPQDSPVRRDPERDSASRGSRVVILVNVACFMRQRHVVMDCYFTVTAKLISVNQSISYFLIEPEATRSVFLAFSSSVRQVFAHVQCT